MRERQVSILFAAGGTGGHLYPAIAMAEQVRKLHEGTEIVFVGTERRIEENVVPRLGFRFERIWISGFRRSFSLEMFLFPLKLVVSLIQSYRLMRNFRPDVVVGTGGFVSGPVVFTASVMGIPTLIQEQNSFPGVTTRLLASRASEVHLSFRESARYFRGSGNLRYTGNPTRDVLGTVTRGEGRRFFGLKENEPTLFVFGGSQGAHSINTALGSSVAELHAAGLQVIWQTGADDFEMCRQAVKTAGCGNSVKVLEFITNMEHAYAAADLALCRSGATTIAELTRVGLASVLVPYPHATADHQTENARSLVHGGAAVLLEESRLDRELAITVTTLLDNQQALATMSEHARKLGNLTSSTELAGAILRLSGKPNAGGR